MKKLALITVVGMVALSRAALAGWSVAVNIVDIEVSDSSAGETGPAGVYLRFNDAPFLTPCANNNSGQWAVGGNADNIKNIMTIATAAKLAGRMVKVF